MDLTLIRKWLLFCHENHRELCMAKKKDLPFIEHFKVIDCAADPLAAMARSWLQPYVALSYVWGRSQTGDTWPRVVRDAVKSTRAVRFRYLWIDRYCIDQDDLVEKKTTRYLRCRPSTLELSERSLPLLDRTLPLDYLESI